MVLKTHRSVLKMSTLVSVSSRSQSITSSSVTFWRSFSSFGLRVPYFDRSFSTCRDPERVNIVENILNYIKTWLHISFGIGVHERQILYHFWYSYLKRYFHLYTTSQTAGKLATFGVLLLAKFSNIVVVFIEREGPRFWSVI